MKLVIVIIFIIIAILNQVEKSRKNGKKTGKAGAMNITPQPTNTYTVSEGYKESRSDKAFRESATYQTSNMVNEQVANKKAVIDVLTEFNESLDRKKADKAKKAKKAKSMPIESKKETAVESVNLTKKNTTETSQNIDYNWSIFDDFAASDALYLARKDVENRKTEKLTYM